MTCVRLLPPKIFVSNRFLAPVLMPCLRTAQKLLEVDRLRGGPDSPGRAIVRDAALRADAGTREGNGRPGSGQPPGNKPIR